MKTPRRRLCTDHSVKSLNRDDEDRSTVVQTLTDTKGAYQLCSECCDYNMYFTVHQEIRV